MIRNANSRVKVLNWYLLISFYHHFPNENEKKILQNKNVMTNTALSIVCIINHVLC